MTNEALEERAVNVVRALAMDAVQRANSGHPGTPMALAPLVDVLFTRVMNYDATDIDWPDRDRFVLSAGHASMLVYSMLYLGGFGLELEDLRQFRQWGSKTPGHPEKGHTKGVEITTGPLGQGIGNAVGIALAEQHLRARFGAELCNHYTFAICSDGDFMEGISHEAASFAGHYQLGHLVAVYDDNHITIDGATELTYTDNVPERFRGVRLGRARAGRDLRGPRRARARAARRHGRRGPADTARAALAHRVPVSEVPGHVEGARRAARCRRGGEGQGDPRAFRPIRTSTSPTTCSSTTARPGAGAPPCTPPGRSATARVAAANPERAEEFDLAISHSGVAGWEQKLPTWAPGDALATESLRKRS